MTADELKLVKKIERNLASYQMHYRGSGPDKRDEVFKLLKELIRGGATEPTKREFDRGYRAGLLAARTAHLELIARMGEWEVPPLAWKEDT